MPGHTGGDFIELQTVTGAPNDQVPPGLGRVTHIFHGNRAPEKRVEHGSGPVPPPRGRRSSACPEGSDTDQCTTNSWSGNYWSVLPVAWSLNDTATNSQGSTAFDFEAAFNPASDTWVNDPNSSFDAGYTGGTERAASSFAKGPSFRRMDAHNDVDFGQLKGDLSGAIAVVIYWYVTSTGEIVEADMRLNQDYPWTTNTTSSPDTVIGETDYYDVRSIVTHEFGHFFAGLDDLCDDD